MMSISTLSQRKKESRNACLIKSDGLHCLEMFLSFRSHDLTSSMEPLFNFHVPNLTKAPPAKIGITTNNFIVESMNQSHVFTISSELIHRRQPREQPFDLFTIIFDVSPRRFVQRMCHLKKSALRCHCKYMQDLCIFHLLGLLKLALRTLRLLVTSFTDSPRSHDRNNRTDSLSPTRHIRGQPAFFYPVSHRTNQQPHRRPSKQQPPNCHKSLFNHPLFEFQTRHHSWLPAIKKNEHARFINSRPSRGDHE